MNLIPPKFKEFRDYCTNFPDKILGKKYAYCCYIHDVQYNWHYSTKSRLQADNDLFVCVRKRRGLLVASLMWLGVRLFGGSHYRRK